MVKEVSVIIPIFNSAATLPRCLDTVLSSSYENLELLLLDDGSADESLNICKEFAEKDARIRVFHHENHGVSYTRNKGLDEAVGDYVMFVDADDTISENWIESYVKAIEKTETELVIGGLTEIKCNQNMLRKLPVLGELPKQKILEMLCEVKYPEFGFVPNKLYDMQTLKEHSIRFNKAMTVQEDLDFFLSYLKIIESATIIPECGYFYDYAPNKREVPMLNLLHNKMKIFEMAKVYDIDLSNVADDACGHVYHHLRNLKNNKNYVDECKKLEAFGIEKLKPFVKRKGEKKVVFNFACKKMYRLLKMFFCLRSLLKSVKCVRILK